MSEVLLNAVLNLFALIAAGQGRGPSQASSEAVRRYLAAHMRAQNADAYLALYEEFRAFGLGLDEAERKALVWRLCDQLRSRLPREEQVVVLLNVLSLQRGWIGEASILEAVIAGAFDVAFEDFQALRTLVLSPGAHADLDRRFLVLDNGGLPEGLGCRRLERPDFRAGWTVLRLAETGSLLLAPTGGGTLFIDGQPALPGRFHLLPVGVVLRDDRGTPCYRSELEAAFRDEALAGRVVFEGRDVDFRFPGSDIGLHGFSFRETSGRLVGVMGGSGAGKSTLLSLLNGTLRPDSGSVLVNGRDLYAEREALQGVIGYVPQDDLLFEDLTVFQNLHFGARLCLAHLPEAELAVRVEGVLRELGQLESRDLKVGSPLDKTISGGQRKRLNIALELIREPAILFADEPTSGLSSADSCTVMSLLKEQAARGCLVIVVIHQPSSQIFKMFDSLWLLDQGGRPVFEGNPLDALEYFRSAANVAGEGDCVCPGCGSVNPEQLFDIIEMRRVDERGTFTRERRFPPEYWHERYLREIRPRVLAAPVPEPLPEPPRSLWKPGLWGQFRIFLARNALARLANRQYVLVNLLEAPLIALVLAALCRYSPGGEYAFLDNRNIGLFFFMSVIVALFMGLSVSAEEIVKDRKILKREAFLDLSWLSYVNAKAVYLAGLTAVQAAGFVLVAHRLLEIPDMGLKSWAILFSCGVSACLLGLNVSAGLRSVVAIYILVPLLLIPQMLLSGSAISFDELSAGDSGHNRVPWYADLMPARWGYEALIVEQYAGNRYMRDLFADDCRLRQIDYTLESHLQELRSLADFPFLGVPVADREALVRRNLLVVANETAALERETGIASGLAADDFRPGVFDRQRLDRLKAFFSAVAEQYRVERTAIFEHMSGIERQRLAALGQEGVDELKRRHHNEGVAQAVRNGANLESNRLSGNRLVQLAVPVCKPADSEWGMAHFAAGQKNLLGRSIPTFAFDLGFLWLISLVLYLALWGRVLPRLLGGGRRSG